MGERTSLRQVVTASLIGSVIEWYDFFIYGTAAALIFGQLFFPGSDPLIGTLYAFGTYAVGFIARPIGGVFCGHYGDKIGRKSMLVMTLIVMGVATTLVGLLPTYESIGIWAPILLVVLRFLQGFAVGGDGGLHGLLVAAAGAVSLLGLARTFSRQHSPRRGGTLRPAQDPRDPGLSTDAGVRGQLRAPRSGRFPLLLEKSSAHDGGVLLAQRRFLRHRHLYARLRHPEHRRG